MRNTIAAVWFRRLVLLSTLLAFCVVGLGAYVRLSDAGLGCPDWPGCYGYMSVPESEAAIAQAQVAYPDSPVETHKAWKEMVHRYLAGILGLLVLSGNSASARRHGYSRDAGLDCTPTLGRQFRAVPESGTAQIPRARQLAGAFRPDTVGRLDQFQLCSIGMH